MFNLSEEYGIRKDYLPLGPNVRSHRQIQQPPYHHSPDIITPDNKSGAIALDVDGSKPRQTASIAHFFKMKSNYMLIHPRCAFKECASNVSVWGIGLYSQVWLDLDVNTYNGTTGDAENFKQRVFHYRNGLFGSSGSKTIPYLIIGNGFGVAEKGHDVVVPITMTARAHAAEGFASLKYHGNLLNISIDH